MFQKWERGCSVEESLWRLRGPTEESSRPKNFNFAKGPLPSISCPNVLAWLEYSQQSGDSHYHDEAGLRSQKKSQVLKDFPIPLGVKATHGATPALVGSVCLYLTGWAEKLSCGHELQ